MKPRIGIVVCGLQENRQFVTDPYIQCVRYAGGLPLILPLVKSNSAIAEYTALCDGFLFCGGGDITPLLFGEEPRPGIGGTDIILDIFQIRLMKKVLETEKPVLAICRGIQILNVACGGTVYQDISLQPGESLNHMQSADKKDVSHKVFVTDRTLLSRIAGRFLYTNSFHHQTLGRLGRGLIVSGQTSDGTIEAVEMPSKPFVVGVQWHPECMYRTNSGMRELFHRFVQRCAR